MSDEKTDITEYSDFTLDASAGGLPATAESTDMQPYTSALVDSLENDFNLSRDTIKHVLDDAENVIEAVKELAMQSDSPRAFEVLANMIKTYADVSKDLVDIHEKRMKLEEKQNGGSGPEVQNNTQNNIVFSGNSEDLFKMLEEKRARNAGS